MASGKLSSGQITDNNGNFSIMHFELDGLLNNRFWKNIGGLDAIGMRDDQKEVKI